MGVWSDITGVNFNRNFTETYSEIVESLQNKTLVVTTIMVGYRIETLLCSDLHSRLSLCNITIFLALAYLRGEIIHCFSFFLFYPFQNFIIWSHLRKMIRNGSFIKSNYWIKGLSVCLNRLFNINISSPLRTACLKSPQRSWLVTMHLKVTPLIWYPKLPEFSVSSNSGDNWPRGSDCSTLI